jgi:uncharacterized membrane protein
VVLAFALVSRKRFAWAAATLAGAVLLKQFALVAAPFLALMILRESGALGGPRSGTRRSGAPAPAAGASPRPAALDALRRPTLAFVGVLAAGILPFFVADPVAFYEDTIKYGAGTYRIVGYGLSAILVEVGIVEDRDGAYPFALLALLTWVPLTAWLLLVQRRSAELWVGAAAFAVSILWLMFIGRTFNNYYLVWPMTGAVAAALMAVASTRAPDRPEPG